MVCGLVNEERGVTFRGNEPDGRDERGKTSKPCTRSLLKAVKGFLEAADVRRCNGVFEPEGLLAVDGLSKMAMKESVLDI